MPNFTECAIQFLNNKTNIELYRYTGPTLLIPRNSSTQITYEGCNKLCGTGPELYPWSEASGTVTTWILPVIGGVLLQAPWQSNEFIATMLFLCRMLGSPVSALSYSLWNINVTGRCAMLVDMSIGYFDFPADVHGNYSSIRDSFTLLVNINQYQMKPIAARKDCESVLRIMLFSTSLRLKGTDKSISDVRYELAQDLRSARKRGVVPVFISIAWFMFAMVLSIQSAFGQLGENAVAHDLAMGLLLSFVPSNILTSIVDRNPAAADDVRNKLNDFVDLVCDSLENTAIREEYIEGFQHWPEARALRDLVERAAQLVPHVRQDFFERFAGQGRVRWHYGAAHPIICDIEERYIAWNGRGWLDNEEEARMYLVLGQVDKGLLFFDFRELWQILAAVCYVNGSILGAFILSYFTPTVGLGCRSGNYMVFAIIANVLFIMEMVVWWLSSPASDPTKRRLTRTYSIVCPPESYADSSLKRFKRVLETGWDTCIAGLAAAVLWTLAATMYPFALCFRGHGWNQVQNEIYLRTEFIGRLSRHQWIGFAFATAELTNSALLSRILVSQTFGFFRDCACQSSIWSSVGGYIDFTQWNFSHFPSVTFYWTLGTALTLSLMAALMAYVVVEWCLQAHLSTADYASALRGLRRTRQFRHMLSWLRNPAARIVLAINDTAMRLVPAHRRGSRELERRKTTIWSTRQTERSASFALAPLQQTTSPMTPSSPEASMSRPLLGLLSTVPSAGSERSPLERSPARSIDFGSLPESPGI